jgi:hypothetical protein
MKDKRTEIIRSLREQNSYWALESERLQEDLFYKNIFLIATVLFSLFSLGWWGSAIISGLNLC